VANLLAGNLRLVPDLDEVLALVIEREALWARIGAAGFLTDDEKRAAAGYEPLRSRSRRHRSRRCLRNTHPINRACRPEIPTVGSGRDGGEGEGGSAASDDESSDSEITLVSQDDDSSYRVDLLEEEERGGHAIKEHIGKSDSYLKARVEREALAIVERGDSFEGLGVGSFSSVASATKLINSTLSQNRDIVNQVATGNQPKAFISSSFNSITGQEAYLARYNAQPFMRNTYGVAVVIVHDANSPNGFRVQSAFPKR
jgi:hypothetical protein